MNYSLKEVLKEKHKTLESIVYIEGVLSKINCKRERKIIKKSIDFQNEWYIKLCTMEKECLRMRKFMNDYDLFEVGETWYTVQSEHIHVLVNEDDTDLLQFDVGSEIVILDIEKESAYGSACVAINRYETRLGLDELYNMVWE